MFNSERFPEPAEPQPVATAERPVVKITLRGGVAYVTEQPENVDVYIYDYDIEGTPDSELDRDDDGQPCAICKNC